MSAARDISVYLAYQDCNLRHSNSPDTKHRLDNRRHPSCARSLYELENGMLGFWHIPLNKSSQ